MSQNLFDLQGRVAVVTGGTSGIGYAIALGLAEAGADVVASSRRAEQVQKVATEIEGRGRRSLRITSDVLDRASLEALHDAVIKDFGKVDILVNAAGVTHKAADARGQRGGLDAGDRDELAGNTSRLPDIRQDDGQSRIWPNHQYRVFDHICWVLSGGCLLRFESGRRIADQGSGDGIGKDRCERERDCAGDVSNGVERKDRHRHSARRRAAHADTDGAVWKGEGVGGGGDLSCV